MTKPIFFKYEKYFKEARKKATKNMDNKYYWIWLSLAFGSNANTYSDKLLHEFGYRPENVYNATEDMLREVFPENERLVRRLADKNLTYARNVVTVCEQKNIGILTPGSVFYPEKLNSISAKPMVLYYKGSIPMFSQYLSVSVVGTRKASQYGSDSAYTIAYDLAKSGAIVISGMADGIDGIAHRGALDAMGQTVAVLGSGVDVIYPKKNEPLYKELLVNGLIISEYPPGAAPEGWHFPQRNRLISALSSATLIVEAAERSGALITAEYAKNQGKLLYAVPGKVGEHTSTGTNELIRSGAKMTTCANDIISDFATLYSTLKFNGVVSRKPPQVHNVARTPKQTVLTANNAGYLPPDDPSGYMSIDVDPRIEEARKNHETRIKFREEMHLKYPDEPLTENGYTVSTYFQPHPRTRSLPKLTEEDENSLDNAEETVPNASVKREIIRRRRIAKKTESQKAQNSEDKQNTPDINLDALAPNERKIVEYLIQKKKATMDEMTVTGLQIHEIMGTMTLLEIQGIAQAVPGGYYVLIEK